MIDLLTLICVILLVLDNSNARKRASDVGYKLGKLWRKL